jgi:HD superfamily phosphohydrolase
MKDKIIKDLAYGFINITEDIAKIIDHRSFQRLKNISQLTAHHVYPSTNHTRFEHSLGVMYLSTKFANVIRKFISQDSFEFNNFHLCYASLLHDIGHAPMSHVGESFYDTNEIKQNIKKLINDNCEDYYNNGSPHELMSCYIIANNFKILLSDIFSKNSIVFDIKYIFRIITGSKYTDEKKYWENNIIIELLNSKTLDIDKIDYLIRDNLMVGNVAPNFDLDRLLFSVMIDSERKLAFSPVGLSSISNIIDCRDFLYLWLYNHHIVVYTDFLYKTAIKHLCNISKDKSENTITYEKYFSCKAIAEYFITDDDIRVLLNKEYIITNSLYSRKILSQLLERKFLKPLWKTIYEFKAFMKNFNSRRQKEILEQIEEDNLKLLASALIKNCSLQHGDLFIIHRSNKFYAMSKNSDFYINIDNDIVNLNDIIPLRRFDEKYSNVAFYVFTLPDKVNMVKNELIKHLKQNN